MNEQEPLITKREVYEEQRPEFLRQHRATLLGRLSLLESEIFLINDVLEGYGEDPMEEYND